VVCVCVLGVRVCCVGACVCVCVGQVCECGNVCVGWVCELECVCMCVGVCAGLCVFRCVWVRCVSVGVCLRINEKLILTIGDGQNFLCYQPRQCSFLFVFQLHFIFLLHVRPFDLYGYGYTITCKKRNKRHFGK
jgi:hypothetical protein